MGEIALTGSPPISPGEACAEAAIAKGAAIAKLTKMYFNIILLRGRQIFRLK